MSSERKFSRFSLRSGGATALAMMAFAANSLLGRAALRHDGIDAASFSSIRLLSGAVTLCCVHFAFRRREQRLRGNFRSAFLLFLYAVPFSFAYESLAAGTGALILFGAVQATMLLFAWTAGERANLRQWSGLALAFGGLLCMFLPGASAPSPWGAFLMMIAGIAWGGYSIAGKEAKDPLGETAGNFLRAVPFAMLVSAANWPDLHLSGSSALLAILSGSVASGLGYFIWYMALRSLSSTLAATVQLSVPALATLGGALFMHEILFPRVLVATGLILGGVLLAILSAPHRGA